MTTFKDLGLNENIIKALTDLGYENPTEIQEKAIPQVIASKQDLKAFAQTGTGKTAAYLLPLFTKLRRAEGHDPRVVVIVPTRELAIQVGEDVEQAHVHARGRHDVVGLAAINDLFDVIQHVGAEDTNCQHGDGHHAGR